MSGAAAKGKLRRSTRTKRPSQKGGAAVPGTLGRAGAVKQHAAAKGKKGSARPLAARPPNSAKSGSGPSGESARGVSALEKENTGSRPRTRAPRGGEAGEFDFSRVDESTAAGRVGPPRPPAVAPGASGGTGAPTGENPRGEAEAGAAALTPGEAAARDVLAAAASTRPEAAHGGRRVRGAAPSRHRRPSPGGESRRGPRGRVVRLGEHGRFSVILRRRGPYVRPQLRTMSWVFPPPWGALS